jgi:hypothetical protein
VGDTVTTATGFGWLLIALGAALVIATAWLFVLARRSSDWPSVRGRVVGAKRDTSSASSKSGGTSYRLVLTYAYEVGGAHLEGHRVAFGDNLWGGSGSREAVDQQVSFFHPGREVTVYYDPKDPSRCTLTRGIANLPFKATFVVGAALIVVGIAALRSWIKVQ